jgi:transposase
MAAANNRRGRYNVATNADRSRIIDAFENDGDYLQVAETLGIKRQTARSIVMTFIRQNRRDALRRGGARPPKVDQDMKDVLEIIINENSLLTLDQINDELRHRRPNKPRVSKSTLSRALDGMLVTMKLAQDVPVGRNEPRVLDLRLEYAQWFLRDGIIGHCIFIDECGYNIWTRRSFGRALRGQPAFRVVDNQRGQRCNVSLATSNEIGLVHHTINMDTVTRDTFETFIRQTADIALQMFPQNEQIYFVYDNARPHVNAQLPPDIGVENILLKKTPPYSPFLNPVEMAHSCLKAGCKRTLGLPEWQRRVGDRQAAAAAGSTMQRWRARLMVEVAQDNIDLITPDKCLRWFNHTQTYLPRCMARQAIEG